MMKDDEIVKEVSDWEKEKAKLEKQKIQNDYDLNRQKIQNRKELWFAIGKNIKWGAIIITPITVLVFLISQCGPSPEEKLEYEKALKECVDKIGYDHCGQIERICPPYPCHFKDENAKNDYGLCVKALDAKKCDLIKEWNGRI